MNEPGSGNHETYVLHLALSKDAKRSISNGPKTLSTRWKALSDRDYSVSGSATRDSASATWFSKDDMYDAKMKIFRFSHQHQIRFEISEDEDTG